MAVEPTTLQPGQVLVLNKPFKNYAPGTLLMYEKSIPVGGKHMPMVAVAGGRGFAVPADHLDIHAESTAAAAAPEAASIEGPVLDFFIQHADMESPLAVNFFSAYFEEFNTPPDTSFVEGVMAGLGLPIGQRWTDKETAQIAEEFYVTFSQDVDPLVTEALTAPEPVAAPVAAPKPAPAAAKPAPAAKAPPVTPAPKAPAPAPAAVEVPSTKTTAPRVDAKSWDAQHVDALRLAGKLMPLYAEFPDSFDAVLAEAVKMLKAADKVR